ncbi:hypothetical protein [Roseibium sp. RKSG952]|uniref:hypothetical protein n=1 Tax=Roseibium sp. RKSG952 TaxID=2529384 RepID=UPI0012BC0FD2|nr:hypothetical protein [Roseibium sp. RKSG952]MTI01991.1 hypothetical protein [Roseibium sp. RKSG952]
MTATSIALFAVGIGSVTFAFWGHYTHSGQQSFEGMSGMIPITAGVFGGLLIVLAVLLAGYQLLVPSIERDFATLSFPDAPRYSNYNHWVLLSVTVAMLVLFDLFCRMTVGVSGILIVFSWFESGASRWGLSILFLGVLTVHTLMVTDTIGTIHTRYFGQPDSSVVVGHDLHNEVFRLYPTIRGGEIVTSHGGTYEDNDVFADRFADLQWEKTLRFGQRAQDVLGWQSYTTKAAIKAGVLHFATLGLLGLFFIGLIGWSVDYQGELETTSASAVETGFSWLWQHHRVMFLAAVLAGAGTMIGLVAWAHDPKLVEQLQPGDVFEPLPEAIRPGKVIKGIVVDHSAEQTHFNNQSGSSVSHYNLLVRIDEVFAHSIWLRITLENIKPIRDWVSEAVSLQGVAETFIVQDDLSIIPQKLHRVGVLSHSY